MKRTGRRIIKRAIVGTAAFAAIACVALGLFVDLVALPLAPLCLMVVIAAAID